MNMKNIKNWVLDVLFPKCCLGCGRENVFICKECLGKIVFLKNQICFGCKKSCSDGKFCTERCAKGFGFDQIIACCDYEKKGITKKIIVNFKYKFNEELCAILGEILKTMYVYFSQRDARFYDTCLVPVPIHKKRLKYRGFNQALKLAEYLKNSLQNDESFGNKYKNLELVDCLRRTVFVQAQAKLTREKRLKNMQDSIEIRQSFIEKIRDKYVILIDDVITTGATMNQCAQVLKQYGAKYVCGLVISRG